MAEGGGCSYHEPVHSVRTNVYLPKETHTGVDTFFYIFLARNAAVQVYCAGLNPNELSNRAGFANEFENFLLQYPDGVESQSLPRNRRDGYPHPTTVVHRSVRRRNPWLASQDDIHKPSSYLQTQGHRGKWQDGFSIQ